MRRIESIAQSVICVSRNHKCRRLRSSTKCATPWSVISVKPTSSSSNRENVETCCRLASVIWSPCIRRTRSSGRSASDRIPSSVIIVHDRPSSRSSSCPLRFLSQPLRTSVGGGDVEPPNCPNSTDDRQSNGPTESYPISRPNHSRIQSGPPCLISYLPCNDSISLVTRCVFVCAVKIARIMATPVVRISSVRN